MRSSGDSSHPIQRKRSRWPLILAANGALLFIVGVSTVRETYRRWQVDQEVSSLQSQVEALERKKLDLSDMIQTLDSQDAVDKEARLRLGLQKPGERVFIIEADHVASPSWKDPMVLATSTPMVESSVGQSNPHKWFAYFFLDKTH